jgi:hypothetical protein
MRRRSFAYASPPGCSPGRGSSPGFHRPICARGWRRRAGDVHHAFAPNGGQLGYARSCGSLEHGSRARASSRSANHQKSCGDSAWTGQSLWAAVEGCGPMGFTVSDTTLPSGLPAPQCGRGEPVSIHLARTPCPPDRAVPLHQCQIDIEIPQRLRCLFREVAVRNDMMNCGRIHDLRHTAPIELGRVANGHDQRRSLHHCAIHA